MKLPKKVGTKFKWQGSTWDIVGITWDNVANEYTYCLKLAGNDCHALYIQDFDKTKIIGGYVVPGEEIYRRPKELREYL